VVDWARLAAYIDGEGHIALNQNMMSNGKPYAYLRVIVTNTDPRLIVWLQRTFGGGVLKNKRTELGQRTCFKWTATCRHAEAILKGCMEYFIMKRDQAEIGLAFQETVRYHRWDPRPVAVDQLRAEYRAKLLEVREPRECDIVRDEHGNAVQVVVN
jgi:hypothetical protein